MSKKDNEARFREIAAQIGELPTGMLAVGSLNSDIVDFYSGYGGDQNGRMLDTILAWSDGQWERCHNHIQWVFPTREPSQFNKNAPLLTEKDVRTFQGDPRLQLRMFASMERFLRFLGSEESGWPAVRNHNNLRITRAILSIRAICSVEDSQDFYRRILEMWDPLPPNPYWEAALPKDI